MSSFRSISQRTGRMATLAALVVATLGQAVLPVLVSADSITSRSIELSSATKSATGVSYKVAFTATKAAGAYVVEFCSNSPVIPDACTAPTGFSAASAALGAAGTTATAVTGSTNKLVVTNVISAAESITDTFTGITNPSSSATMYARIVSYDNATDAGNYASATLGSGVQDQGSVAIAITDTIGVSGAVAESLLFCVSGSASGGGNPITSGCTGTLTAPTLKLGEDNGTGGVALVPSAISSGTIYTQLSTNAANGVVVNLKSSAASCGGLKRVDDGLCGIKPANGTNGNVAAGSALFGVKTGAAVSDTGNGSLAIASGYNATDYKLNAATDNSTGVTSTYGDEVFNAPGYANSLDMPLTFGASVANNTPAGNYSADLNLVATGTF
ncbi:MAG TPA: hypothetical protein VLF64_00385 [Candidatus Saccharimonadales bacterium]|nr:hypothetical protein [Candidatus Saccharimonadales bacterium]